MRNDKAHHMEEQLIFQ